jgi:hypothetical protein
VPTAPAFSLPAADAAIVGLTDLLRDGPAVLVFVEPDCPTCRLMLERLGAAGADAAVVICEDRPEVALRFARRAGFGGRTLGQAPPYATSRDFSVHTVPTTVLVSAEGDEVERVVGWDQAALQALLDRASLGVRLDDAPPDRKPGCQSRATLDDAALQALRADAGVDDMEEMFARGWTDGLPVVPPTPERVERMLGGRDPAASLGLVPPGQGEATLERMAACAVLAGCTPAMFPVVIAAVEAALDPAFNLNGLVVTTSPPGQVLIVNGPIRRALGLNSGMGALGPGFRANLTIGRALRLVVTLTGGGRPGGMDRATLAHPAKLSFLIAEDEEGSPWSPLHVERGHDASTSTVTLLGAEVPISISDHRSRTPESLAACLGWGAAHSWSPAWWPMDAISLFVIGPEHAATFREHGWSKDRVREAIFAAPRRTARELRAYGEAPPEVHAAEPDAVFMKWPDPSRIQLVVAGGDAGRFSAVLGPALSMGTAMITREIAWNT